MEPPRRRPRPPDRSRIERAKGYHANDEALRAMGGFPGREHINVTLLHRLATLPGARAYFSENKPTGPNFKDSRAHTQWVLAETYRANVVKAFNGNEQAALEYLKKLGPILHRNN